MNRLKEFSDIFPRILKFQILTHLLFIFIILPSYFYIRTFIVSLNKLSVIDNTELLRFVFSPLGIILLIISLMVIFFYFLVELSGLILLTSSYQKERLEPSFITILKESIKLIPKFLNKSIIVISFYFLLLIPITSSVLGFNLFKKFNIPNFIFREIIKNPIYLIIYSLIVIIFYYLFIKAIFTFHYILIKKEKSSTAIKKSFNLINDNFKDFFDTFILRILKYLVIFLIIFFLSIFIINFTKNISKELFTYSIIFLLVTKNIILTTIILIFIPLEIKFLTDKFYEYTKIKKRLVVKEKDKYNIIDKIFSFKRPVIFTFISMLILLNVLFIFVPNFFNNSFKTKLIIGHRGGEGVENSLGAIKNSIDKKIDYVEIDIQRTKDNYYIVNHDKTFKRVAGINKSASDMTLKEIKKISLRGEEKIPEINEVLKLSKNKINLFIELKGKTADKKMVDDIVKLVKKEKMEKQVVFISMRYSVINYLKTKYKDLKTGFIYFLFLGDMSKIKADYMLFSEDFVTENHIEQIHKHNKKAIVWTVNSPDSMKKYLDSAVDGIITDRVNDILRLKEKLDIRSDKDLVYDLLESSLLDKSNS
jgi:glycerophosphodiester phosphodiesterase family protein